MLHQGLRMIAFFAAALASVWSASRSGDYGLREDPASASEKAQGPEQGAGGYSVHPGEIAGMRLQAIVAH